MKRYIMTVLSVLLFGAMPVSSFAATYGYINIQGNFVTEIAANTTQALTQPKDIDPHSGVLLMRNFTPVSTVIIPTPIITSITIASTTGATSTATFTIQTSSSTNQTATTTFLIRN